MKAFYQLQNLRSSWFQDFRVDKCFEIPWNHFPQALNMIAVCKLHQPRRIVLWVSRRLFAKKYVNCKLKLHSKGFYEQILGGVTVLKFFQTFALDFPNCLQCFRGNFKMEPNVPIRCLQVKMDSKTVTTTIAYRTYLHVFKARNVS